MDVLELLKKFGGVVKIDELLAALQAAGVNPDPEAVRRLAERARAFADKLDMLAFALQAQSEVREKP